MVGVEAIKRIGAAWRELSAEGGSAELELSAAGEGSGAVIPCAVGALRAGIADGATVRWNGAAHAPLGALRAGFDALAREMAGSAAACEAFLETARAHADAHGGPDDDDHALVAAAWRMERDVFALQRATDERVATLHAMGGGRGRAGRSEATYR